MNEILLNNQILPIVLNAGFTEKIPDEINSGRADYNIMLYITGGRISVTEDSVSYDMKPGDLLFLKHNTDHSMHISGKSGIRMYYFLFYMEQETKTSGELMKTYTLPKCLEGISGSVLDGKIHDYTGYFQNTNELTGLNINTRFYDILSECIKLKHEYHTFQNSLSDKIINYLHEYSNQPLNTTDMEKRFYLTYKYMGTAFKKNTGSTILGYHTAIRMEQAQRLLTTTLYSIDEISRQLGYSDALYFSRVFKKHYGQSPQIYRKNHLKST